MANRACCRSNGQGCVSRQSTSDADESMREYESMRV